MTGGILTDGVVILRPSTPDDAQLIIAARDAAFRRSIGQGSAIPAPEFVIVVHGSVVGWVDHDRDDDRWWLAPEEVNIGYHVFPEHRGRGHATRAVRVMLEHLRADTDCDVATLLIHPDNTASLKVAERSSYGIPAALTPTVAPVSPDRVDSGAGDFSCLRQTRAPWGAPCGTWAGPDWRATT